MNTIKEFFQMKVVQKVIALFVLMGTMFLLSDMLNILLLTFIFSYLFYSLCSWILKRTSKWIRVSEKIIVLCVYGGIVLGLALVGYVYAPPMAKEVVHIADVVTQFDLSKYEDSIHPKVMELIKDIKVDSLIKEAGNTVMLATKNVGGFLISLLLSIILSFFFAWERKEIVMFMDRFKKSKIGFVFQHYAEFASNFSNTFGKVLQLQILISLVNCILSVILLSLMGFHQVLGLAFMIFVLGLIPVVGVVISLVPLSIIAFQLGGWIKIVHVLIMIIVLHAFESYVLNPKLMSIKMKLPVFVSFSILIFSEHVFGVWGLLVGIPLFMFFMDLIGASPKQEKVKNGEVVVLENAS